MTKVNIIDLNQEAAALPEPTFNSFRLSFNSAFLNEQFDQAYQYCLQVLALAEIKLHERAELVRCLLMLGKADDALQQIDLVLLEDAGQHELALSKAEVLRLRGNAAACRDFLRERLELFPAHKPYYQAYLALATELNAAEELDFILHLAQQNGLELKEPPVPAPDSVPLIPAAQQSALYADSDLLAFLELFPGRENCHARQWVADNGNHGYSLVPEPLNLNLLRNHLLGISTLGVYQLDSQSRVKWIAFDLDIEKSHLDDLHDPDLKAWLDAGLRKAVSACTQLLDAYHIPVNVEFSGFKGYHLWVLLQEKISAAFARLFAQRIAAQVNLEGLPLKIEIFPKQARISAANYGNLVKLPYGIHRVSGLPSSMLAEDGSLIPFADFVRQPRLTSAQDFLSALRSLDPNFTVSQTRPAAPAPSFEPPWEKESAPAPDPETDPEWLCLKQNCHALWTVDNLIKTRGSLSSGQKNVLRFTCGYLKQGPALVNHLLRQCSGTEPADLMRNSFKGNAISCAKIRSHLAGELDPNLCNCDFSLDPGMYPTPLLHLKQLDQNSSSTLTWNELKLKELIASYLKLKKDSRELAALLEQKEQQIIEAFSEIGVSELSTPYGRLCKAEQDGVVHLNLILK